MGDEINYSENSQKVLCGLFGTVGLMIVLGVLAWSLDTYQFVKGSTSTEGTVVALNAGGSHPQIKFTTADGKEIEYAQNGLIRRLSSRRQSDGFIRRAKSARSQR